MKEEVQLLCKALHLFRFPLTDDYIQFFQKKSIQRKLKKGGFLTTQKINKKIIFPTFHPAAAMRFPRIRDLVEKDFLKLKKLIRKHNIYLNESTQF